MSQEQSPPKQSRATQRTFLAAAVLIVILVAVFIFTSGDREPVCNGKKLSQWAMARSESIRVHLRYGQDVTFSPQTASWSSHAEFAIQRIGTNGLPFLLDWLTYENSTAGLTWKQKVIDTLTKIPMPPKFKAGLRNSSFNAYPEPRPRPTPEDALWCFRVLGSNAAPAIPRLTKIALQRQNWQGSVRAVEALGAVGPKAVPTLLDLATNYACPTRRQVVVTLTESAKRSTNSATDAIPRTLVRCVRDGDVAVERQAARSVGELKVDPRIAFPVLTNGLLDPNLAYACVEALGQYGETAQPTLPALLELRKSHDPELRDAVSNAVVRISPESRDLTQ